MPFAVLIRNAGGLARRARRGQGRRQATLPGHHQPICRRGRLSTAHGGLPIRSPASGSQEHPRWHQPCEDKNRGRQEGQSLLGKDLHAPLKGLRANIPADARDGALLALGWAGALRRNELVSLDWQEI